MRPAKNQIESKPISSEQFDRDLRTRAATLIETQRDQICKRISILLLPDARKLADTEDVLSTAMRRVDRLIARGLFRGEDDIQVYALVHRVLERTIKEKARNARRIRARERLASELKQRTGDSDYPLASSSVFERIGQLTTDPIDQEIAMLRARGMRFHEIAAAMDMTSSGIRKRWSRLRENARQIISEDE